MGKAGENCGFIYKIHWGVLCGECPNTSGDDKEEPGKVGQTRVGTEPPFHCSIPSTEHVPGTQILFDQFEAEL